jgi:hypothetical protein
VSYDKSPVAVKTIVTMMAADDDREPQLAAVTTALFAGGTAIVCVALNAPIDRHELVFGIIGIGLLRLIGIDQAAECER